MYQVGMKVLLKSYEECSSTGQTYLNPDMQPHFGLWCMVEHVRDDDEQIEYVLSHVEDESGINFAMKPKGISSWVFNESWISYGTGDIIVAKNEDINSAYNMAKDSKLVVIEPINDAQVNCQILDGRFAGRFCVVAAKHFQKETEREEKKEMDVVETFVPHQSDTYEISNEELDYLTKECIAKYDYCDIYEVTYDAVEKAVKESVHNKAWLWNAWTKHPNYIGHGRIVFDADYERSVDKRVVDNFAQTLYDLFRNKIPKEIKISSFKYREVADILEIVKYKLAIMNKYHNVIINGMTKAQVEEDYKRFYNIIMDYKDKTREVYRNGEYIRVSKDDCAMAAKLSDVVYENIFSNYNATITKENADKLNEFNPDIRANGGQKKSRLVNKIAKLYGINFDDEPYLRQAYAQFADAINPFVVKRHTILSLNPADFLTMSWGTNWTSCHTIDKENLHGYEGHAAHYHGCYSSGTLSYQLDGSSFIYYTVNGKREVEDYGKELKESRQMFHIGEDKLIQGRLYPYDQTDCDNYAEPEAYTQIRIIVQRIVSELFGISNYWSNKKGTGACGDASKQTGTHYHDITNYNNCNVSILHGSNNETRIEIGHDPICPQCGTTHDDEKYVTCSCCQDGECECYECGNYHNENDMHYIDGYWYCENCCFYCEYHGEWETGESYYVENYGDVCEDAIDYGGDFFRCEYCDEYYYDYSDYIETHDGHSYCCESCAEHDGYVYSQRENAWYQEEEVTYCDQCGTYVLNEDYDEEREMCDICVEYAEAEEMEAV